MPPNGSVVSAILPAHTPEQADEDTHGRFGARVAAGECLHDVRGAHPRSRVLRMPVPGVNGLDPASRQDVLDIGKSVSGLDELCKTEICVIADGHGDVTGFGRRHIASRIKVMNHSGVEAGADTDHELRCTAAGTGLRHDLAQMRGRDMTQCVPFGLQVVQERDGSCSDGFRNLRDVNAPVDVGEFGGAVLDRAGDGDTGHVVRNPARSREVMPEQRRQVGMIGIPVPANRIGNHD